MEKPAPLMLMILDGWGINPTRENNAVAMAQTPNLDRLFSEYPNTHLNCSGPDVGLPKGVMGNSEVGHLNIGAGRVVYQTLLRIDRAIEDRTFFENPELKKVMETVKAKKTRLHIMGLVSDGGVHSQFTHLLALVEMAVNIGISEVLIHAILDGRDTPPDSGKGYITDLQNAVAEMKQVKIATLCGRFYAMDRDTRWDRTELAYNLYTEGEGLSESDPVMAVKNAYGRGETDEFVKPVILDPSAAIKDGDGLVFFNFRADRARQITRAFTDRSFSGFRRRKTPVFSGYVCMALYDETFDLPVAFGKVKLEGILGQVVSRLGLSQLRIAETEKYAHVTYFFNGGDETPFPGEDRCLIPSPREAATYDLIPQMSAEKVANELVKRIEEGRNYDLIVVNFANMDMVGHTGVISAAVTAVETVDGCVGRVIDAYRETGGAVIVTADHGNSEQMTDENGGPHTAHTLNPVPLILVSEQLKQVRLKTGCLGDIAPTILSVMGIKKPEEMTGNSLIC
jgi:2,3-bisphosphoglycerate-independent phosphoglycerate mutase